MPDSKSENKCSSNPSSSDPPPPAYHPYPYPYPTFTASMSHPYGNFQISNIPIPPPPPPAPAPALASSAAPTSDPDPGLGPGYIRIQTRSTFDAHVPLSEVRSSSPDTKSYILEASRLGMTGSHSYSQPCSGQAALPAPPEPKPEKKICVACGITHDAPAQIKNVCINGQKADLCWSCVSRHLGGSAAKFWNDV